MKFFKESQEDKVDKDKQDKDKVNEVDKDQVVEVDKVSSKASPYLIFVTSCGEISEFYKQWRVSNVEYTC